MSKSNTHQDRRNHLRKHKHASGAPRRLGIVAVTSAVLAIGGVGHAQHGAFEITPIVRMDETVPGSPPPRADW